MVETGLFHVDGRVGRQYDQSSCSGICYHGVEYQRPCCGGILHGLSADYVPARADGTIDDIAVCVEIIGERR